MKTTKEKPGDNVHSSEKSKLNDFQKRAVFRWGKVVLSLGLFVVLCSGSCSRHGSCPAYGEYAVKKEHKTLTAKKLPKAAVVESVK